MCSSDLFAVGFLTVGFCLEALSYSFYSVEEVSEVMTAWVYWPYGGSINFPLVAWDKILFALHPIAFRIHVTVAPLSLFAGLLQFSSSLRARFPKIHRRVGYLYATTQLIGVPAGIYSDWECTNMGALQPSMVSLVWE